MHVMNRYRDSTSNHPEGIGAPPLLYYVHDPMCSWCWAFRPVWEAIRGQRPPQLGVCRILGGLAPDTREAMPVEMQLKIQSIWRTIQQRVPGTEFNFDFWSLCRPRRSTYPACRAIIAATSQGREYEEAMILAIQTAYYLQARNPSDAATLIELAEKLELDPTRFAADLDAEDTRAELSEQIAFARRIGARGFPSLILEHAGRYRPLQLDYRNASNMLGQIEAILGQTQR